jgi:hypothetical protein
VVCVLQEKTDWDAAKRVLSDATFITRLIEVCGSHSEPEHGCSWLIVALLFCDRMNHQQARSACTLCCSTAL